MRLIDADAFKKVLSEHEMQHDKRRSFDDYACGAANAYEYASDLLDDMPTAERPHGEWIYHKNDKVFECSECHYNFDEDEFGLEIPQVNATWVKVCVYNFCPNCGADMREGDEK